MNRPLTVALTDEVDGAGGAEVLLVQLGEELRKRGHTVIPVLPTPKIGWLQEQFRERGFEQETYTISRPLDLSCLRQLREIFRRRKIDVVHSHEFTMAVYGTAAAASLRIPHVITMHGNQQMTARARRRVALRWAFRNSSSVVAVSADTTRHLEESLGVEPGVIRTIPNGVPRRFGDPAPVKRELGLEDGEVVLLAVGSLVERKGHHILIRALARISDQPAMPAWRLLIAGVGEEEGNLRALVEKVGLGHRIAILGHREDIPALQEAADVFVMPSLWEGLPLAILEAMFAANPVLASRTSGIPEAITHGKEGLLVPPGDEEALASALAELLQNAEMRSSLGAAAQARALANFTVERMTSDYEQLYSQPLG